MLVAQISDTHIAQRGRGPDALFATARHLEEAVGHLKALPEKLDALIVSGDLVDAGSPAEYLRLRSLLSPLDTPIYLIPGNHDDTDQLRVAFGDWGYFPAAGKLHYTVDHLPVRFVFLDSSVTGRTHGHLGERQLAWLDERLAQQPGQPTVIVLHHPPFHSGIRRMDLWCLSDAEDFSAVVSTHSQVERVVCGHLHRAMTRRFGGTIVQVCPSTAQQLALDLLDGGNSLTVTMEPPSALLHRWDGAALVTHQIFLRDHGVEQKILFATGHPEEEVIT